LLSAEHRLSRCDELAADWQQEAAMFLHEMLLTIGAIVCTVATVYAVQPLPPGRRRQI
jgi:hypothetical protein